MDLLRLSLVAVVGCGGAPEPGRATAIASVSASVSAAAAAPPSRSYIRGPRAHAVVDEDGPFSSNASVSPDGLLIALQPSRSNALVFYDIDRRRIVGRAEGGAAAPANEAPLWLDDDHVLVAGYSSEAVYDARRGVLLGQVRGGAHGAIATNSGLATLARDSSSDSADLVLFSDPTRKLARVRVEGSIRAAYDFGNGAFAYRDWRGLYAFEPDGKARWQRAGELEDLIVDRQAATARLVTKQQVLTVSLRDGKELTSETRKPAAKAAALDGTRVILRDHALFERGQSGSAAVALLSFQPGPTRRLIEPAGGASFAARCENGAISTLGSVKSLPRAFARSGSDADSATQLLLSKGGSHRVTWTPNGVTLTEIASNKARVLAAGNPLKQVELHPNGESLVTAAHVQGVGFGWHPDPDASVRIFDLASGALTKKLAGESFRFSDDGTRLLVLGSDEAGLYDAASYKKLRSWPGVDSEVSLDHSGRFVLVKTHERPPGGMGPHETKERFVEELQSRRRVIKLNGPDGHFAFDEKGSRFAFAAEKESSVEGAHEITIYDLASGKVSSTLRQGEPLNRLAFLGGDKILAVWTNTGSLVLHRQSDGRRVTLFAVAEAEACRLFAVDEEAHFQGEPGARLAFRYGDDLRTSEVVAAGAEAARADDRLLEKLFAGL